MRNRLVIMALAGALVLLGLGVLGLGPVASVFYRTTPISDNGGVAEIDIQPVPEGPGVVFQSTPTSRGVRPLAQIEQFIPDPLPAPLFQGLCGVGGDMVIILGNGKRLTYGPCHRPASIDRLWAEMFRTPGP